MKAKNGMLLSKGKDNFAWWAEHFREVLSRPEPASLAQTKDPFHILPINADDI